jgi:hypothetical protein
MKPRKLEKNKDPVIKKHVLPDLVTLKNNKYNFRYSNTAHLPTVKTTRND